MPLMVETLKTRVELKRMHSQGHIVLPVDWGKSEVGESGTVHREEERIFKDNSEASS